MVSYDRQTLNTPNPIARYAHRHRLKQVVALVSGTAGIRKLLDYGCGSGAFVSRIQGMNGISAVGYEPFMPERVPGAARIHTEFSSVEAEGPFDVITLFETIEHLTDAEIDDFLQRADRLLSDRGKVLLSAPIEIGPAVLAKEFNRCLLHRRRPENTARELFLAAVFGIVPARPPDVRRTHKGFDFRHAIRYLEASFGPVDIACYGPLPIGTWFGNSQVYFWLTRGADRQRQTADRQARAGDQRRPPLLAAKTGVPQYDVDPTSNGHASDSRESHVRSTASPVDS